MLSLGWSEITIIVVVVILVIGPKELPHLLKNIGMISKKIKSFSREFNTSVNNIIRDADIDKVQKNIKNISSSIDNEIVKEDDKSDLKNFSDDIKNTQKNDDEDKKKNKKGKIQKNE